MKITNKLLSTLLINSVIMTATVAMENDDLYSYPSSSKYGNNNHPHRNNDSSSNISSQPSESIPFNINQPEINSGLSLSSSYISPRPSSAHPFNAARPQISSSSSAPTAIISAPEESSSPFTDGSNPVLSLPQDVQGVILGELNRPSFVSYSRTNKETYNTLHALQDNPKMRAGIRQALSTSTFNLDQPGEKERLISFLNDANTSKIYIDINSDKEALEALDWPKILPLCTYIRFIKHNHASWATPLLLAVRHKLTDIALNIISTLKEDSPTELQQYLDHKNQHSLSALELACDRGMQEAALALIAAGAKIDTTDKKGDTPLIFASINGLTDVVKSLINKMKEIKPTELQQYLNHKNQYGLSAPDLAFDRHKYETWKELDQQVSVRPDYW